MFDEDEFSKFKEQEIKGHRPSQPGTFSQLEVLNLFLDEPEELEYDIVNIDRDLMKVPKYFIDKLSERCVSHEYLV